MNWSLKLITPPVIEPVSIDDVKSNCRVELDFVEEDHLFSRWIRAGRLEAEKYLRRALITQTWEISFNGFPEMPIIVPRAPLRSVSSIKYYDTDNVEYTIAAANYYVNADIQPGMITHAYSVAWPSAVLRGLNSVKIQYVAGYGNTPDDVPENITDAIILFATHRHENRAAESEIPKTFYHLLDSSRVFV
jgi:uncharacterized phiE125 gp8 family phage protein